MTNTTPETAPKRNMRDATPGFGWRVMDALGVHRLGVSARRVFGGTEHDRRAQAARDRYRLQAMQEVGFGGPAPTAARRPANRGR